MSSEREDGRRAPRSASKPAGSAKKPPKAPKAVSSGADGENINQVSTLVATDTYMALGLACFATTFALGVAAALWCGLLQRLLQTGGILREAHEAIARFPPPLLLLLPGLIALSICLLFSYWLIVSLYIGSAGTPIHGVLHPDRRLQLLFWVHTIGVAWSAEAILHLGFCAAAGVAVRWYFGADIASNGGAARVVLGALGSTLRYNPGSLALGALLVIPGRIFRFLLEHCLHQAQTDGSGKPELRGVANCCLRCCLDVATRYLQYMSHNAYILIAVHDVSFLEGARQAFELTLSNIGEVALLTAGERLLLTLAKLSVACFCTAGVALSTRLVLGPSENASGAALFTFALTFCVADAWIGVLDAAVEAIFLCYLVDVSENDGETRPYYASAALRAYMDRHRPSYVLPCSLDDEEARAHAAALFEAEAHAMRAGEHGALGVSSSVDSEMAERGPLMQIAT